MICITVEIVRYEIAQIQVLCLLPLLLLLCHILVQKTLPGLEDIAGTVPLISEMNQVVSSAAGSLQDKYWVKTSALFTILIFILTLCTGTMQMLRDFIPIFLRCFLL